MACKFKYGDKVFAGKHKAKVVSISKNNGKYICRIKFDNRFMIPSEMDYDPSDLEFQDNHEDRCPYCLNKWKITKFNNQEWKDCSTCNEKAEVLIKMSKEEDGLDSLAHGYIDSYKKSRKDSDDALLEEFERMIDSDDDDDFGYFNP